ncbi:MAG TPA: hypothetical protein VM487_10555 [Phycisphaerae bacterium]|nr:hypothetical protein [Phycisphaerae bacterium]
MIRFVLAVFDSIGWLLRRLGVDYAQFRAILEAKLTIDTRVRGSAFQTSSAGRKSPRNVFAWTLLFNAFMGAFIAFLLPAASSPLVSMTIVHSFIMLMVGMALIADFATVLLDTADSQILQPRPVSSRTILAARLAHITTYLSLITFSLAAGTFVVGTITYHWLFALVFGVTLLASVVLVVSMVAVLYLLLMRFINEEKLRDLITYVQIAMTVVVVGGYQLLPRMMDMTRLKTLTIEHAGWIYYYPPAWLAAPEDLLVGNSGGPQLILTVLAIIVPLAALLLVVRLAPAFRITPEAAISGTRPAEGHMARVRRPSFADTLAGIAIRQPAERAAFGFLWRICTRDRQFKRRTYPSFAFIFIFAAVFMFRGSERFWDTLATLPETKKHLLLLYFASFMLPAAILNMRFTDQPDAAWVYRAAPLERPGVVLAAGVKVLMLQLVVPAFTMITAVILVFWGPRVIPDIVLAFGLTQVVCWFQALMLGRALPFSEPYGVMEGSGRMGRTLLLVLVPLALGLIHYGLTFVPLGVLVAIPVAFGLNFLAARRYDQIRWSALHAG